jgi:hypothetical protein
MNKTSGRRNAPELPQEHTDGLKPSIPTLFHAVLTALLDAQVSERDRETTCVYVHLCAYVCMPGMCVSVQGNE